MRDKLKGRKSYLIAGFAVLLGVWGVASGEMSILEGVNYVLGGGAIGALRGGIG